MTEKVEKVSVGYVVKENIYVKADRKTVVAPTDKEVAFLRYGIGTVITPAQNAELIFPDTGAGPLPDASQRSAAEVPDAPARRKGK
jgi:hypothetical protein